MNIYHSDMGDARSQKSSKFLKMTDSYIFVENGFRWYLIGNIQSIDGKNQKIRGKKTGVTRIATANKSAASITT